MVVHAENPQKQVLEHVEEEVGELLLTDLKEKRMKEKKYFLLLALFEETLG